MDLTDAIPLVPVIAALYYLYRILSDRRHH